MGCEGAAVRVQHRALSARTKTASLQREPRSFLGRETEDLAQRMACDIVDPSWCDRCTVSKNERIEVVQSKRTSLSPSWRSEPSPPAHPAFRLWNRCIHFAPARRPGADLAERTALARSWRGDARGDRSAYDDRAHGRSGEAMAKGTHGPHGYWAVASAFDASARCRRRARRRCPLAPRHHETARDRARTGIPSGPRSFSHPREAGGDRSSPGSRSHRPSYVPLSGYLVSSR